MRRVLLALCFFWAATAARADEYSDFFRSAALHAQRSEYAQALADYEAALAVRPASPEALNNSAVMLYQLHRYSEAFQNASKIWRGHPELRSAALVTGMSAVQCNHPKEAIAPLQFLLTADPANYDALLALASAYLALGDLPHAVQTYETDLSQRPEDVTGWYGAAICYERSAELSSAKLARLPGGRKYSKLLLAQYLQGAGDEELAAEAFGESAAETTVPPAETTTEYDRARSLASKAQKAFEHVLAIAPSSWQAAVFLGDVARQHGDLLGAIQHYREALTMQPENSAALLGLGTAYWELGDFEQASGFLNKTLKASPHAIQPLLELSNIAVRQHRETDAIPLLKQFLTAQPDARAARADLGLAYLHLSRYSEAVDELSKAVEGDDRGDIHYQLSVALKKSGRPKEAEIALKQSSALRRAQLQREEQRHKADNSPH